MKTKNLGSGCPHQVQTHWSVLPFQDSKSPSSFINNNKSKRPIPGISDSRPTLWADHCVAGLCLLWIHSLWPLQSRCYQCPPNQEDKTVSKDRECPKRAKPPRWEPKHTNRAVQLHIPDTRARTGGGGERKVLQSTRFLPEKLSGLRFSSSDVMSDFFGEIPFFF